MIKNDEQLSNLKTHCHFKLDFLIVGQHTGGNGLLYGTKYRQDS